MLPLRGPARARVARRIDADPTSTALLLAGPTAVDLWPGVRRVGEVDGRLLVEADPAAGSVDGGRHAGPALLAVRALPPRRTPTAYVTRFSWSTAAPGAAADGAPVVAGRLTLAYAATGDGTPVTHAVLELEVPDGIQHPGPGALGRMAEGFLTNLARAAETRNRAA